MAAFRLSSPSVPSPESFTVGFVQFITLILCLSSILVLASVHPFLGPLYDCSQAKDIGVFQLNHHQQCVHNMHDSVQPLQLTSAHISKPILHQTPISLVLCSAYVTTYTCKESFFGSKSRHQTSTPLAVSADICLQALHSKTSPYGTLHQSSHNRWDTHSSDRYICHWMKTDTERYNHFVMTIYNGLLVGDDPTIHQDVTKTICRYDKFSCQPSELPSSILVWDKSLHNPSRFMELGNYTLHRLGDFILIPKLGIGGAIQNTSPDNSYFQLDNGFLCKFHSTSVDSVRAFTKQAKIFLKSAKPSVHTDLLEAHIAVTLEIQRASMISSWEQLCRQERELDRIRHWMIKNFPDSSAQWIDSSYGHRVEFAGDGILISRCSIVNHYTVFWNRTFNSTCYRDFPVLALHMTSPLFLDFGLRQLTPFSSPVSCSKRANFTYVEDYLLLMSKILLALYGMFHP